MALSNIHSYIKGLVTDVDKTIATATSAVENNQDNGVTTKSSIVSWKEYLDPQRRFPKEQTGTRPDEDDSEYGKRWYYQDIIQVVQELIILVGRCLQQEDEASKTSTAAVMPLSSIDVCKELQTLLRHDLAGRILNYVHVIQENMESILDSNVMNYEHQSQTELSQRSDNNTLGCSTTSAIMTMVTEKITTGSKIPWQEAYSSLTGHMRRDIVHTLYQAVNESDDTNNNDSNDGMDHGSIPLLLASAGVLQELIGNRMSIQRDEWFRQFCVQMRNRRPNAPPTRQELLSWFVMGTWCLYQCGLIQWERIQPRKGVVYEKASVVWCSGDD